MTAKYFKRFIYLLAAIAIVLACVWFSMPPPLLEGTPGLVCISYFVCVLGVFAGSIIWLAAFGSRTAPEGGTPIERNRMVALLVSSTVVLIVSAVFVLLALVVGGLFRMI